MRVTAILITLLLLSLSACKTERSAGIHDDFEADSLSRVWDNSKFLPGALELQSSIVRSGSRAAKLSLKKGDQINEEKGSQFERAELREPKKIMSDEHRNYSYSFSIFLPSDFPIVPTRLVIAQWKQNCSGNCDPDNPVIALRYQSGEFQITLQTGPERTTLYSLSDNILNKWMDFRFDLRFSRNNDGYVKGWLNNREILNFKGVTAYSSVYGYADPGNFYFKIGLYRDTMADPMTIFIDDYTKQELSD
jgi:hypothetical protein